MRGSNHQLMPSKVAATEVVDLKEPFSNRLTSAKRPLGGLLTSREQNRIKARSGTPQLLVSCTIPIFSAHPTIPRTENIEKERKKKEKIDNMDLHMIHARAAGEFPQRRLYDSISRRRWLTRCKTIEKRCGCLEKTVYVR